MTLRLLVLGSLLFVLAQSLQAASNPVPFIGQPLAPATARPGTHGVTVTIRGTGFVSGSVVQWNGQALPTTFLNGESCSQLAYGSVSLLKGAGDGTFTVTSKVLTGYHKPLGIAAGDFNGDGKTDLAVVGLVESSAFVIPGNGKGGFGDPVSMSGVAPPFAGYVAVGDFNGDGRLDFAENNPSTVGGIIEVSVQTQSAVAFYPAVLKFPPQQVGTTSAPKKVKFANIGTVPVNISKVQIAGYYEGTNNCPRTLPVGADCTVSVTFSPGFVGLSGGLVIVDDDALGAQQLSGLEGKGK